MPVKNFQAKLIGKTKVAANTYKLSFQVPDANLEFTAGQFMSLLVAPMTRRSYSIASNPQHKDIFETFADTVAGGPGSKFIESSTVGDTVQCLGPLGTFLYQSKTSPVYFCSTGTGITPFLAMIKNELLINKSGRTIKVILGFRTIEDIFAISEIEELQKEYSKLSYVVCLSQPENDWEGFHGRITKYIEQQDLPKDSEFYLCGAHQMLDEMEELLIKKGLTKDQIYYEQFY